MSIRIGREVVTDEELRHLARPRDPAKGFADTGYRFVYPRDSGRTFRVRFRVPGGRKTAIKYHDLPGPFPTERVAAAAAVVELRRRYGREWWRDRFALDRRSLLRPRQIGKDSWVCDVWVAGFRPAVVLDPGAVQERLRGDPPRPAGWRPDRREGWATREEAAAATRLWLRRRFPLFGERLLCRGEAGLRARRKAVRGPKASPRVGPPLPGFGGDPPAARAA